MSLKLRSSDVFENQDPILAGHHQLSSMHSVKGDDNLLMLKSTLSVIIGFYLITSKAPSGIASRDRQLTSVSDYVIITLQYQNSCFIKVKKIWFDFLNTLQEHIRSKSLHFD